MQKEPHRDVVVHAAYCYRHTAVAWSVHPCDLLLPIEEAYNRFSRAMLSAAHATIPRGIRARYIPCMAEEAKALLEEYEDSGDPDIADHLIESLDAARRARWEESTAQMNFTHSSRKSWALLRRLGAAQRPPLLSRPPVSANVVASHLVKVAKSPSEPKFERSVRDSWRQFCRNKSNSERPEAISPSEILNALKRTKTGTAPGYDNIHPE